ncbi:zinc-binding dehydrogenase [Devosia algicola]|uniref:Zinc-binding dehydrogenase n=1 Tax=Devosia algicola TaxID=3026418 RepID=A0ABY7YQF9_9HYPH|nr:zinc-binding dehydrogenase [Devosia algicola]WDR03560.1 zinc-binding dehydrogenase [Devosia algicola]
MGSLTFKRAFAEPVAIGVQSCRRGAVTGNDSVLVLGAGPIGLAILEVARARGAMVYVTDVDPKRLLTAAHLGAQTLDAGPGLLENVMKLTNGEGMPVVMEATGNAKVMESTTDLVAAGGRVVIVGIVPAGTSISFPGLDLTRKEMSIVGSRASVDCFSESLELLASGAIRYPEIASRFEPEQAVAVFDRLVEPNHGLHKVVFTRESK